MFADSNSFGFLQQIVQPWYESLRDPRTSQEKVLGNLVGEYGKTNYGRDHHVSDVGNIETYRNRFPTTNYRGLTPYIAEVEKGDSSSFLPEPLVCWVMTRGSTGPAKVLPVTRTHLEQIFSCGARALVNYVVRKKDYGILSGNILNLNFPSNVHTIVVGGQTMTFGYSSGTYAKLNPTLNRLSLIPKQEAIDALGSGITKTDWEKRFELAYQQASSENVTAAMGVTPVIVSFARYVEKKYGKKPKELWNLHALFCTSVRKIQFKYAPVLKKYFGDVPVVEIYSATEGVFAQQLDDFPYVTPNYDKYLLEVETGKGTKMLHELKRGEWGKLIVSSCILPRYDMGDMIEAAGKDYFRVFGRHNTLTLVEHRLYRLFLGAFI